MVEQILLKEAKKEVFARCQAALSKELKTIEGSEVMRLAVQDLLQQP